MQIANVFLCRSERASLFSFPMSDNRLIWAGIVLALVLIGLIDYTPLGNRIFSTAPISVGAWLFVIPFAFGMLAVEEGRKWLVRERRLPSLIANSECPALSCREGNTPV